MSKRIDLLSGSIGGALTRLALPLMGMSLIQMAYSLTDIFWIGRLGAGAVAAVGTCGQLLWFSQGLHTIAQLGGQVYVAQKQGAGELEEAGRYASAAMILSTSLSVLLGLIFLFCADPIIAFFQFTDAQVILESKQYIHITGGLIFFMLMAKLLTALITTTGDSKTPFIATSVGLICNIVLDPILIFGVFGLPALGVQGAAIATLLAQVIVFVLLFLHILRDKHLFSHVSFKTLPPAYTFRNIVKLGLPTTFQATFFPGVSLVISRYVAGFGEAAVAVQRIGSQIEAISWMTADGFSIAVNSFMAQNYGAGNLKRAKAGYYQAAKILGCVGIFATALLILGDTAIFKIFIDDAQVIEMGAVYMVILGISQLPLCFEILSGSAMNALGKTMVPAIINVIFTGIRVPLAALLSATALGLAGIWWSVTLTTILKGFGLTVAIVLFLRQKRFSEGSLSNSPLSS